MKLILLAFSVLVMATFAEADEHEIVFVYITERGLPYQPDSSDTQPSVRILSESWGYDLQGGEDAEVCIVTVDTLRGGDAPITPPTGSFLILSGTAYQLRSDFEADSTCNLHTM